MPKSTSKFAGFLPERPTKTTVAGESPSSSPEPDPSRAGKRGSIAKSKDDDFRSTSLLLNKKAYVKAYARLKTEDVYKDVSTLVSEFLDRYGDNKISLD